MQHEHFLQKSLFQTLTMLKDSLGIQQHFSVDKGFKYGGNAHALANSLKSRGVINGVPDCFIFLKNKLLLVELKKDAKAKLSSHQEAFKDSVIDLEYVVYLKTHDIEEIINIIKKINGDK